MSANATESPAAGEVASLQVSLPQMLDLALGTPEVGAVNLNLLHNFLHILLHEINLRATKVEYRGDDANRIKTMVSSLQAGPSLYLQEYSIIDESNAEKQRVRAPGGADVSVDVVAEDAAGTQRSKGKKQTIAPGKEGEHETVIFVEPIVDGATPTALGFKRLEQTVNELQQRFQALEDLAKTPELIERLKGKITDPVSDVWQIINITKRLDATEEGIDKLTKMVQDVIKGGTAIATEEPSSPLETRLENLEQALSDLNQLIQNLDLWPAEDSDGAQESRKDGTTDQKRGEQVQAPARISIGQLLGGIDIKEMRKDVTTLQQEVSQMRKEIKNLGGRLTDVAQEATSRAGSESESGSRGRKITNNAREDAQSDSNTDRSDRQTEVREAATGRGKAESRTKSVKKGSVPESPKTSVSESPQTSARNVKLNEGLDQELQNIKDRISKLEDSVSYVNDKLDNIPNAAGASNKEVEDLVPKIQEIQNEMERLNQTADRLIDDRENREMHLNALLEQVELLKTIKADREDLEEALADKADAQAIKRKVSYDQFDAACDDLAQGLEEAIGKLGKQESIWQEALEEIQKEIEGKVDKMEMSPLKDFVNHRLKSLQDKLKKIASEREETEAAGTKKLLRDVQCISCDKDVVMRMDEGNRFKVDTLPCSMSMKPYLTYELDQVRKQHRRLPHSRNMIQFEAAVQEDARKQKGSKGDAFVKTPRDHLCNRYCGGSHTVTTPQQRVMRTGHFFTQWGPEVVQLTEGMIKGTDGRMYKSRRLPEKIVPCGATCSEERSEDLTSCTSVHSRRLSDKQVTNGSKKRHMGRISREMSKEIIDELVEPSTVDTDDQESVDVPMEHAEPTDDRMIIPYTDDSEEEEA